LPAAEVATRLGPAGAALVRAARGIDERPLAPEPLPAAVEEALALEYALDNLEPLLFVLRGLVERALARLGLAGIGCARVDLALGLDDHGRDARTLSLGAPTRDVKAILGGRRRTASAGSSSARSARRVQWRCSASAARPCSSAATASAAAWSARPDRGASSPSGGARTASRATTTTSS